MYQLAADMRGMGFIHSTGCDPTRNSALINPHMIDVVAKTGGGAVLPLDVGAHLAAHRA